MKKTVNNTDLTNGRKSKKGQNSFPGYPTYAASEDIYFRFKKEKEFDPIDLYQMNKSKLAYKTNDDFNLNENILVLNLANSGLEFYDNQRYNIKEDLLNSYFN